jgi:hypothetical protein
MEICYITPEIFFSFTSAHSAYNCQAAKKEKHTIIFPFNLWFNLNFPKTSLPPYSLQELLVEGSDVDGLGADGSESLIQSLRGRSSTSSTAGRHTSFSVCVHFTKSLPTTPLSNNSYSKVCPHRFSASPVCISIP